MICCVTEDFNPRFGDDSEHHHKIMGKNGCGNINSNRHKLCNRCEKNIIWGMSVQCSHGLLSSVFFVSLLLSGCCNDGFWKSRLESDLASFKAKRNFTTRLMNKARREFYSNFIDENNSDQKNLFRASQHLFIRTMDGGLPPNLDGRTFSNDLGKFFVQKIDAIRMQLDTNLQTESFLDDNTSSANETVPPFPTFTMLSVREVKQLIQNSALKTCPLDPMPSVGELYVTSLTCGMVFLKAHVLTHFSLLFMQVHCLMLWRSTFQLSIVMPMTLSYTSRLVPRRTLAKLMQLLLPNIAFKTSGSGCLETGCS